MGRLELTLAKGYGQKQTPHLEVPKSAFLTLVPTPSPQPPLSCSYLTYSVLQHMQKPSRDPAPGPSGSPSSHWIVRSRSLKLKSGEERALTPVKDPQLQGARCLQPALAALLAPLCRALPVPLGQHQQWAGPNKSRLSRHRRQADPLRCTVGMRWPQGLPGG